MKYFFSFCNSCGISGVCMFFPESDVRQDKRKILCASCFEEAQNQADAIAVIDELKMEPFSILQNFKKFIRDLKKQIFGKLLPKVKLKKATKEVKQVVALYEKGDLERFEKALDKLVQEDERGFENENT